MSDFLNGVGIGVILGWLFGGLYAMKLARESRNKYWESAAVKAGHAEYYLDENNEKQWRWK